MPLNANFSYHRRPFSVLREKLLEGQKMASSQPLTELVHTAQSTAKTSLDRMSEILKCAEGQTLSDAQIKEIASETDTIKLVAVDIFTVFEARMQRHFKRGPLSRKVQAALLAAGHADLADRLHQYYLAINVLKHGHGASHRELLNNKSAMLVVTQDEDNGATSQGAPTGLIDVASPHFFEGLAATILDAYQFLESR
ncbi:hypothetical protein [Sulfitobacter sp. M13]